MRQPNTACIAVITPTIGTRHLTDAISSVQSQLYKNVNHYLVVDGEQFSENVMNMVSDRERTKFITLPFNTGKNGFNGHRIYAAMSLLVEEEFIFFLDEDNSFDPNHISSLVHCINASSLDWAFSLRKIVDREGHFLLEDNCESIGPWQCFSGGDNLVDTNCYAMSRRTFLNYGLAWYHRLGADRQFFKTLHNNNTRYASTGMHSVNYRVSSSGFPNKEFFQTGNAYMIEKYNGVLPWLKS